MPKADLYCGVCKSTAVFCDDETLPVAFRTQEWNAEHRICLKSMTTPRIETSETAVAQSEGVAKEGE